MFLIVIGKFLVTEIGVEHPPGLITDNRFANYAAIRKRGRQVNW